jgi:hypothetical protein
LSKEKGYPNQSGKVWYFCNSASTSPDERYKENEPRTTEHVFYADIPKTFTTKQLLRKKNNKKNLYRAGMLGVLGIMSNTNPYLLPVVPVVPVQKLSN